MPSPLLLDTTLASIGGAAWIGDGQANTRPLVIALHGGGFGRGYFTGPHALPAAASAYGADCILLDRPGANDSRFHSRRGDILADNVEALGEAVTELWQRHGAARTGIFLVGHSIGGAIALMLAAQARAWPLLGIAVSGIGDRPPTGGPVASDQDQPATQPPLPRAALAQVMLAPGAADDAVLDALQAATVPVVTEELAAIYALWPDAVGRVLATITRPVQLVLSEYEPLWIVDEETIARLRRQLRAPLSEVIRWAGVGHCIDYHDQADAYHRALFTFMKSCESEFDHG